MSASQRLDSNGREDPEPDKPPPPPPGRRPPDEAPETPLDDLKIVVARWAPQTLADDTVQPLVDAGADHVATTLLETRDRLRQIVQQLSPGLSEMATVGAA